MYINKPCDILAYRGTNSCWGWQWRLNKYLAAITDKIIITYYNKIVTEVDNN